MNNYIYEIVTVEIGERTATNIKRTSPDSPEVTFIPTDPANSDYQAYLVSLEPKTTSK